ncbi:GerAB/ArcD/ProY family transporter [Paenibacillus eucommiae]|uniref:Spore germination protein (Amino acid permease) n=1 Tax=Paenibacillus eucommiae TaxID=1355755 RepID=A0ABS4J5L0_9BACL|nr:endospore germination permease [Paenibacillus eucommiae]MBP1995136.1 spore germination protein (amino acid permease) [Paenibacillus eucommiae]
MKKYAFNEITLMQFICLNFGLQVSVGLLALPRVLAERADTDGWLAIIIGWLISIAAGLIIVQVMKKHPDGTLLDLLKRYVGEWAGKAGAILFALYIFYYGYTSLVRTILYTKVWLLPQTPLYITLLLLLIPTYAVARSGLRILGRYAELVIFISLWIPFVYLIPLKDAHWIHLFPVFKGGWMPILSAVHAVILSYSGLGAVFIFYPFLRNKRMASAGIVISNTLTMLAFLFITLVCFVYFSPDEIREFNEPVVNVLKTIEFKFIERIEILFIAFYLFIFSLAWIPAMYMCIFCTSWLFGKQDHRGHLRILWLLLAVCSYFYLPTFNQNDLMEKFLSLLAIGFEGLFPVCLLVYIWIYERFQRRKNA